MALGHLIDRCRRESRDLVKKFMWEDQEWIDYLNEAVDEACIRARLIENEAIELEASAGDPYVAIPDYVWSVQRVTLDGRKLDLVDKQMIDTDERIQWEEQAGTPVCCYETGGKLRLYPIPEASGVIKLHAFCTPEKPMASDGDEPEGIKGRLQVSLVDWALHCAYSKKDADTFSANLADVHEGKFERVFGPRPDEKAMRRLRINVRRHVKGCYF